MPGGPVGAAEVADTQAHLCSGWADALSGLEVNATPLGSTSLPKRSAPQRVQSPLHYCWISEDYHVIGWERREDKAEQDKSATLKQQSQTPAVQSVLHVLNDYGLVVRVGGRPR